MIAKPRTVYKYDVPLTDVFRLDLPAGAEILTVQVQDGKPRLWALVDPERPTERYMFRLAGTGHPIKGAFWIYIGTFQLNEGALVFHLFGCLERNAL